MGESRAQPCRACFTIDQGMPVGAYLFQWLYEASSAAAALLGLLSTSAVAHAPSQKICGRVAMALLTAALMTTPLTSRLRAQLNKGEWWSTCWDAVVSDAGGQS